MKRKKNTVQLLLFVYSINEHEIYIPRSSFRWCIHYYLLLRLRLLDVCRFSVSNVFISFIIFVFRFRLKAHMFARLASPRLASTEVIRNGWHEWSERRWRKKTEAKRESKSFLNQNNGENERSQKIFCTERKRRQENERKLWHFLYAIRFDFIVNVVVGAICNLWERKNLASNCDCAGKKLNAREHANGVANVCNEQFRLLTIFRAVTHRTTTQTKERRMSKEKLERAREMERKGERDKKWFQVSSNAWSWILCRNHDNVNERLRRFFETSVFAHTTHRTNRAATKKMQQQQQRHKAKWKSKNDTRETRVDDGDTMPTDRWRRWNNALKLPRYLALVDFLQTKICRSARQLGAGGKRMEGNQCPTINFNLINSFEQKRIRKKRWLKWT